MIDDKLGIKRVRKEKCICIIIYETLKMKDARCPNLDWIQEITIKFRDILYCHSCRKLYKNAFVSSQPNLVVKTTNYPLFGKF